jgi:hypothetical protein
VKVSRRLANLSPSRIIDKLGGFDVLGSLGGKLRHQLHQMPAGFDL